MHVSSMKEMKERQGNAWVGLAPTSRATCRICKTQIPKGSIRLIQSVHVTPSMKTQRFSHASCAKSRLGANALLKLPMSENVKSLLTVATVTTVAREERVGCETQKCTFTFASRTGGVNRHSAAGKHTYPLPHLLPPIVKK